VRRITHLQEAAIAASSHVTATNDHNAVSFPQPEKCGVAQA